MMSRILSCGAALMLLVVAAPAAAQYVDRQSCAQGTLACDQARQAQSDSAAASKEMARWKKAERERARRALLKQPPLPAERNGLLGSWRLGDGQQGQTAAILGQVIGGGPGAGTGTGGGSGTGAGLDGLFREISKMTMGLEKGVCEMGFGSGITFSPSTYSMGRGAGLAGRPIAYRAGFGGKPVIAAIPGDSRLDMMVFAFASPDRIVGDDGCVLVRGGAPPANAAANATTAPGGARAGAASPSAPPAAGAVPQVAAVAPTPPPSSPGRPSPEVCRNTLLDKLGTVGTNQVRAMSDVRFKEVAIEGKVPNSNNLRIDLRGSACDDPRIKATLYDFDANEMLQSITYVWARPPGPAPAPIFSERITQLSRFHSLPSPQSPSRLQADTSVGRLILEDLPQRNLLLEAYSVPK